jgi:hypothetical protein
MQISFYVWHRLYAVACDAFASVHETSVISTRDPALSPSQDRGGGQDVQRANEASRPRQKGGTQLGIYLTRAVRLYLNPSRLGSLRPSRISNALT